MAHGMVSQVRAVCYPLHCYVARYAERQLMLAADSHIRHCSSLEVRIEQKPPDKTQVLLSATYIPRRMRLMLSLCLRLMLSLCLRERLHPCPSTAKGKGPSCSSTIIVHRHSNDLRFQ